MQSKDPKKKFLKIFVDSGGCSGFQYNFKMVEDLTENERYEPSTSFLTCPTHRIFEKDGA